MMRDCISHRLTTQAMVASTVLSSLEVTGLHSGFFFFSSVSNGLGLRLMVIENSFTA